MKIFELTMLFIGAIIGAGFATGAEIVTFFDRLALPVWVIAGLVGITLFTVMAVSILLATPDRPAPNHWLDYLFTALYLVFLVAMTAAVTQIAGAFVSLLCLTFSVLVVKFGFHRMTRLNTLIVISIIIVLCGICLPHIIMPPQVRVNWHDLPGGVLWALLYAGLNCFMFPELVAAAVPQHKKSTLYAASGLAAFLIAFFVYLILTTIKYTQTQDAVMPLLAAAPHPITFVVILLAILTSQYSSLFAIMQKMQTLPISQKTTPNRLLLLVAVLAFAGSGLGFQHILNFAYPLVGAFICAFLGFSLLAALRRKRQRVHH